MSNTILIKRSSTPNSVPTAGSLAQGELAINLADGNLFYKNSSDQVTVIASNKFLTVTGNVTGGNITTAGLISATGNITGGNLSGTSIAGTLITAAQTNITSVGTLSSLTVTGNVTGGNLLTAGLISATGAVTASQFNGSGAGLTSIPAANVTGTLSVNTTGYAATVSSAAQPNITSVGTLSSVSVTGTATVGNVDTAGTVSATGNVTGGNLVTAGTVYGKDALFTGNLTVDGDLTYINITDLNVEDPLISLGGGPNGAPLVGNDGKDRGEILNYFNTSGNVAQAAFIGYQNLSGKLIAATNASVANNVVTVNNYGTFVIGDLEGTTVSATGNIDGGNLRTSGLVSAAGNVRGGNINTVGLVSAIGNIIGGNVTSEGVISGAGNISGGNIRTTGLISAGGTVTGTQFNGSGVGLTDIPAANVTGTLSVNTTGYAATVSSAAQPNITSLGTLSSVSVTGNVNAGLVYSASSLVLTVDSTVDGGTY